MSAAHGQKDAGLVGRQQELARLQAAVDALAGGRGGCVLITGEPGIGKSALARALAEAAQARRITPYWGHTWEGEGAPAYWPWTQLFRRLTADQQVDATELPQILPEHAQAASGATLQPEQARFRLFSAVQSVLAEAFRETPGLLILEDLHAADTDSLSLFLFLSKAVAQLPVLLLGTFREMEARSSRAAEPLWQAARAAEVLRPGRLEAADIGRFVEQRTGRSADRTSLENLLTTTEGNPLFVTELIELLARDQTLAMRLPDSIGQVIGQQVDRLPTETADVLPAAAILGRSFAPAELANLVQLPVDEVQRRLQAPLDAGFIEPADPDEYRFYHALCVDALLQQLTVNAREALHGRHAAYLQAEVSSGHLDRSTELATHLSRAGSTRRTAAVSAWRSAAARAADRLAFAEAAEALARALACFGDGPLFPPESRCKLLLDLAGAELTKGDIQAGQSRCREAFEFARAVGNANLMAQAALTYGNVIVVARVDPVLVHMLEETLAALPADDASNRARIIGRLAAARQPAPDPNEPMALARHAIDLARSTEDDRVVFEVLRSAVSALMDFAPAEERILLNREYGELARRFGDVPARFRSMLRLIIDAGELGDRALLDESVLAVEQLAERIGLPHYAWRAASMKALRATIDGDFRAALRWLDEAEALAVQAEDEGAKLTLPLQRLIAQLDFAGTGEQEAQETADALEEALTVFPDAETYVRPLFLAFRETDRVATLLRNDALVDRVITGGDRFTQCLLGELAAQVANRDVARRAYEHLEPFADQCATLGLMGSAWYGPVAHSLGLIASALGDSDAAAAHFALALEVARRMHARPAEARTLQSIAALARATGDQNAARTSDEAAALLIDRHRLKVERGLAPSTEHRPTPSAVPGDLALDRDGDVWRVTYDGEQVALQDSKGLQMLSALISHPDQELHVLDLTHPAGSTPVDAGDAGPELDAQARNAYRARIAELEDVIEEAGTLGDTDRADAAREELEFIGRELSRAFGISGRSRRSTSAAERARVNVQRRLRDAIRKISVQHPRAGRYLENTIKTGSYCSYRPT